jgi:hypothetical protein
MLKYFWFSEIFWFSSVSITASSESSKLSYSFWRLFDFCKVVQVLKLLNAGAWSSIWAYWYSIYLVWFKVLILKVPILCMLFKIIKHLLSLPVSMHTKSDNFKTLWPKISWKLFWLVYNLIDISSSKESTLISKELFHLGLNPPNDVISVWNI